MSESNWNEAIVNEHRRELARKTPGMVTHAKGVLVIDETGDVKDGTHTAHVGRQYLGNVGTIDNGVVSVSNLLADEQIYYPLEVMPCAPATWFERGRTDPGFRTKLMIAIDLVKQAVALEWPFKAVVADSFYGEDGTVREAFIKLGIGYVMALKPSHGWWHRREKPCSLKEVAHLSASNDWLAVNHTFRDGHQERWWALEVTERPYGPQKKARAVVVTTDPSILPEHST